MRCAGIIIIVPPGKHQGQLIEATRNPRRALGHSSRNLMGCYCFIHCCLYFTNSAARSAKNVLCLFLPPHRASRKRPTKDVNARGNTLRKRANQQKSQAIQLYCKENTQSGTSHEITFKTHPDTHNSRQHRRTVILSYVLYQL